METFKKCDYVDGDFVQSSNHTEDKEPLLESLESVHENDKLKRTDQLKMSSLNHVMLSALAYVCSISYVIFILYKVIPGFSFFSIHPISMTLAYGYLMFQAVMFFSSWPLFARQKRANKVTLHWTFQISMLILSSVGFFVVVYNKFQFNKNHFVTWHSWFGLAAYVLTIIECSGGIMAKYPANFKAYQHPLTIKTMHAFSACITFLLVAVTLSTGLKSNYFTKLTKETTVVWQVSLVVPFLLTIFVSYQVVQSFLPRFKSK